MSNWSIFMQNVLFSLNIKLTLLFIKKKKLGIQLVLLFCTQKYSFQEFGKRSFLSKYIIFRSIENNHIQWTSLLVLVRTIYSN